MESTQRFKPTQTEQQDCVDLQKWQLSEQQDAADLQAAAPTQLQEAVPC
jgi:hypothetical protein